VWPSAPVLLLCPCCCLTAVPHSFIQVRRHTEAAAEELRRQQEQDEQLTKAGAAELAVSTD